MKGPSIPDIDSFVSVRVLHTGKPCAEQKRIISDFPKNLQKIEKDQRTGSPETTTTKPPQPTSYIYILNSFTLQ